MSRHIKLTLLAITITAMFSGCTQLVTAPISLAGSAASATIDVAGSAVGAVVPGGD